MTNSIRWKTTAAEDGDCAIFTDGSTQELVGVASTPTQAIGIVDAHNRIFAPTPELEKTEPIILYFNTNAEREDFIKYVASLGYHSRKL